MKSRGPQVDAGPVSRILYGVAAVTVIPLGRPLLTGSSDLPGSLAHRAGTHSGYCYPEFLPYLVLLRVGFAMPRTLLPERCALTAPFHPYRDLAIEAVSSLWHFPSDALQRAIPDVIRHAALWSSDFPLSQPRSPAKPAFAAGQRPSGPASAIHIIDRFPSSADSHISPDSVQAAGRANVPAPE